MPLKILILAGTKLKFYLNLYNRNFLTYIQNAVEETVREVGQTAI